MGMTDEMDLTEAEWLAKRVGGLPYYDNTTVFLDTLNEEVLLKMSKVEKTPRDFNWVDRGGVSSVKNQAQCGSCAAFAAVGAIESCTKITVGNMADDLSEQHLLDCAYNHVVTAVQANSDWSYYNGGVLDSRQCCNAASDSSCIYNLNHAVLVVGYGRQSGQDYWLIKNSWGRSWGENGFVKVKKGTGHCGVGSLHQTVPTCA